MAAEPEICDLLCLDLPKAERVREGLPAPDAIEALAASAKALGDPTRLAVALALDAGESACVCDPPGSSAATSAWSPTTCGS